MLVYFHFSFIFHIYFSAEPCLNAKVSQIRISVEIILSCKNNRHLHPQVKILKLFNFLDRSRNQYISQVLARYPLNAEMPRLPA